MTETGREISGAVRRFWLSRDAQERRQAATGRRDQGARGAGTGGGQMNGFISLISKLILETGIAPEHIHHESRLELPGFFRPTKKWDILVVKDAQLIAAIEAKSQVGPSFGNNFNNRTEEAIGSALDLWTAFREGAFNNGIRPWLGYLFLLEDCPKSSEPVAVQEPHFKVFPEFKGASYARRYELLCRKLVRESHYNTAAFLTSKASSGRKGDYSEPAEDLIFAAFARSLVAQVSAFADA